MAYCPVCMNKINAAAAGSQIYCTRCGAPLNTRNEAFLLPVGTVLSGNGGRRYIIGKALGQGGFGVTYIALEEFTGRRVAVKEYFPVRCARRSSNGHTVKPLDDMNEVYEGGRYSFLNEAKMLSSLEGMPSVVQGLAYMELNNTAYLVMEYLDGTPLYRIVRQKGKITVEELFPPLKNLMYDISKLHDRNVIHRDISPDNIMLMPDGSLKLLDFGCARSIEDGKSMTVAMKKGFAPVEQYQSHGQGPWTDVYALAATIYYCLTGIIPPESVARTLDGAEIESPIKLGAALTPEEENILMWALTVSPKSRPANMEVFAKHLFPMNIHDSASGTGGAGNTAASFTGGASYTGPVFQGYGAAPLPVYNPQNSGANSGLQGYAGYGTGPKKRGFFRRIIDFFRSK